MSRFKAIEVFVRDDLSLGIQPAPFVSRQLREAGRLLGSSSVAGPGTRMRKMTNAFLRIFRSLIGLPDYTTYDPPFPGDGI